MLAVGWDEHEVNIGPVQTQLRGVGPVDLDICVRHRLLNQLGDLLNYKVFDGLHLFHDLTDAALELLDFLV